MQLRTCTGARPILPSGRGHGANIGHGFKHSGAVSLRCSFRCVRIRIGRACITVVDVAPVLCKGQVCKLVRRIAKARRHPPQFCINEQTNKAIWWSKYTKTSSAVVMAAVCPRSDGRGLTARAIFGLSSPSPCPDWARRLPESLKRLDGGVSSAFVVLSCLSGPPCITRPETSVSPRAA